MQRFLQTFLSHNTTMKKNDSLKKHAFAVIATDIVIFTVRDNVLQVLLIKMKKKPFAGKWAMPGGLIRPNEPLLTAAKRLLREKGGISGAHLEQLYTFGRVDRDPLGRVVSVGYTALLPSYAMLLKTTSEYGDIAWFPIKKVPSLAYDHNDILTTGLARLRAKLEYTTIVKNLLPKEFTLTELQHIYEVVLGKKLDKRNFRKKLLALDLLKKTGKRRGGASNRPAELYTFIAKDEKTIDIL